jgi:uncharacterized protein (DUF1499 family)
MLVALVALVQIWRRGLAGAGRAAFGILLPMLLLAWPLTYVPAFLKLPKINDVTTDVAAPPRFAALAKLRTGEANPAAYPGSRFATEQRRPIRTCAPSWSTAGWRAFELVEEVVRKLKWKVAAAEPPAGKSAKGGLLEATDQTMVVGFTDDIIVRVEGNATRSRIDVRSASRYGQADLGQNATRVRRFLAEMQSRVDGTFATTAAGRRALRSTRAGALVKKLKGRDQQKVESRNKRDRVQSSAQRGRGQKETLR